MRERMSRKAGKKVMFAAGLISGKVAGTMIAVAKFERRVKVVRFWMEPPILPAIIGAAVAVGMIKHMSMPCARILSPVQCRRAAYEAKAKSICAAKTTQCQRWRRRSRGFTLQKVKKSIKKMSHGSVGASGRKSL